MAPGMPGGFLYYHYFNDSMILHSFLISTLTPHHLTAKIHCTPNLCYSTVIMSLRIRLEAYCNHVLGQP